MLPWCRPQFRCAGNPKVGSKVVTPEFVVLRPQHLTDSMMICIRLLSVMFRISVWQLGFRHGHLTEQTLAGCYSIPHRSEYRDPDHVAGRMTEGPASQIKFGAPSRFFSLLCLTFSLSLLSTERLLTTRSKHQSPRIQL